MFDATLSTVVTYYNSSRCEYLLWILMTLMPAVNKLGSNWKIPFLMSRILLSSRICSHKLLWELRIFPSVYMTQESTNVRVDLLTDFLIFFAFHLWFSNHFYRSGFNLIYLRLICQFSALIYAIICSVVAVKPAEIYILYKAEF